MTISMFDAYVDRMDVQRAHRMMDNAQSAIYAQLTSDARTNLWNHWNSIITGTNREMNQEDNPNKNILTWNGAVMSIKQLMGKFRSTFGHRSVVQE